jgi:hypothetical protein
MGNKTSATKFLLVASVFTACAGATKPDVPDTETQRKVRTDLELCNVAAGGKGMAPPLRRKATIRSRSMAPKTPMAS